MAFRPVLEAATAQDLVQRYGLEDGPQRQRTARRHGAHGVHDQAERLASGTQFVAHVQRDTRSAGYAVQRRRARCGLG
jgi:hypothetical protein